MPYLLEFRHFSFKGLKKRDMKCLVCDDYKDDVEVIGNHTLVTKFSDSVLIPKYICICEDCLKFMQILFLTRFDVTKLEPKPFDAIRYHYRITTKDSMMFLQDFILKSTKLYDKVHSNADKSEED